MTSTEPRWPRFPQPVYFALGSLSNPNDYGEIADRLGKVFPDFHLEIFQGRHHFDHHTALSRTVGRSAQGNLAPGQPWSRLGAGFEARLQSGTLSLPGQSSAGGARVTPPRLSLVETQTSMRPSSADAGDSRRSREPTAALGRLTCLRC